MRAIKAHTWKDHIDQVEIAEKSAKKFESFAPKSSWGANNKGHGVA